MLCLKKYGLKRPKGHVTCDMGKFLSWRGGKMDKYNGRFTTEVGKGALPEWPAMSTPWNKLISFNETYQYSMRHLAVVASSFTAVMRIIVPDYEERSQALIDIHVPMFEGFFRDPEYRQMIKDKDCIHPFLVGPMCGVVDGDRNDESLWMQGRVNDYGTYRFEKELDACPWDICGSELCRCTTAFFEAMGKAFDDPKMEFNMVEAKGCGDLHCRCIGENRDKYPMPPRKRGIDYFGPVATADQIKFTPEEEMFKAPMQMRPECDFVYRSGLCAEVTAADCYKEYCDTLLGIMQPIRVVRLKEADKEKIDNVIKAVFEASGKMAFGEFSAIKGVRDWLGVPNDVNDGRVLGALIEMELQAMRIHYEIKAFDGEDVVYDIDLNALERGFPELVLAYLSMWNGMAKTFISAMWQVWKETEDVPENTLRVHIAKRVDKFA